MKCLIIDDDKSIQIVLASLIEELPFLQLQNTFDNGLDAIHYLKFNDIDLIFLDIEMPKMTGIEFLENLEKKPLSIIVTSKRDYAVEAFEHQAVDYILKPIQELRFNNAVNKAKDIFDHQQILHEATNDFIYIKDKGTFTKIQYNDIMYIQAMGDYMKIFTPTKWYILHSTMKALIEKLPNKIFYRCHRSFIVNFNKIEKLNVENNILEINNQTVSIGDLYKQGLLKILK